MGTGPSKPRVRRMNTADAVQGMPRRTSKLDVNQTSPVSATSSPALNIGAPAMASTTKSPMSTHITGPTGLSAKTSSNGSPAKRPTAFMNIPRNTTLNVNYNGLAANRTIESKRQEAQAHEANVSSSSKENNSINNSSSQPAHKGKETASCSFLAGKMMSETNDNPTLNVLQNGVDKQGESPNAAPLQEDSVNKGSVSNQDGAVSAEAEKVADSEEVNDEKKKPKPTKRKTPEEIAEKFEAGLLKTQAKCELLLTIKPRDLEQEGAPYTHDFRQCVLNFATSYFYFKMGEAPITEIQRYRRSIGEYLCQEQVMKTILGVLLDGLKRQDFFDESGKGKKEFWFPIKNMLLILVNYSDFINDVKFSIAEYEGLIPQLIKILETRREAHMNMSQSEEQEKLVQWCMSILHNCGALEEIVPTLRDHGTIPLLLKYTDSPAVAIRLGSIATLADLVNESEAELLSTNPRIFKFILNKLERALKSEHHRDVGWSVEELVRAVRQLARNDANKAILVNQGCLPVLLETIQVGNDQELKEALDCVWTLSFDDGNKQHIVAEPGLIHAVCEKYHALFGTARRSCHGILWSLRDILQQHSDFKDIVGEILSFKCQPTPKVDSKVIVEDVDKLTDGVQFQGHVMISYQWGNQEIIKRICSELRSHGIPVWIDIDYMGGSTLQAMAQAVEDSFAVIIAMSQKYKDSPNTRAEAEYTFQQRKPIVPLIMQNGYRPDGWLGLILGSKLYYDFSGKYSFESRMEGLLKAVLLVAEKGMSGGDATDGVDQPLVATKAGAMALTSPSVQTPQTPAGHAPSTVFPRHAAHRLVNQIDEEKIKGWSKEDVSNWLSKFNLTRTALKDLSGEEIVFMGNLKHEAPEFFYHCLDKKLDVTSLLDLAAATKAFGDLPSKR